MTKTKIKQKKKEDATGLDDDEVSFITLVSGGDKPETFNIDRKSCELSEYIQTILIGDTDAVTIPTPQVPSRTLKLVVDYLKQHKGKEPDPLPCPVRAVNMNQICSEQWDATWIDKFDRKTIFEIILAANYMDIKPLLHLGCAKIATEIKKLDQKEINKIIEEEEKYRREHQSNNNNNIKQDDVKVDNNDNDETENDNDNNNATNN